VNISFGHGIWLEIHCIGYPYVRESMKSEFIYLFIYLFIMNRNCSVNAVTVYGMEDWGSITGRGVDFTLRHRV
jgi:hypothetical protein